MLKQLYVTCPTEDYEYELGQLCDPPVPFRSSLAARVGVIFAGVLLAFWSFQAPLALSGQTTAKALTQEELIGLLEAGVSPKRVEALVQDRGLSFTLTPQFEQTLRRVGADAELIEFIRQNAKPAGPPELVVESNPGGAQVFVDNDLVARTSAGGWAKIATLLPGPHSLRVSADGYSDLVREIDLKAGETLTIKAVLGRAAAMPASIHIDSKPAGATVYLDGKPVGTTGSEGSLRLSDRAPGKHRLRLSVQGFTDFEQSLDLTAGKTTTVTAVLEPSKAATSGLTLEGLPRGATVFVDDTLFDKSSAGGSLNIPDLAPGKHRVRVAAEGYSPFEQIFDLGAGSILTLRTSLVPLAPTPGLARENAKDGMKYVWIPPGTFMMGCSPGETQNCLEDERPSHRVTISRAFWMGQMEVTVGAYKRFVASAGKSMPSEPVFGSRTLNPGWANERMPIVNVNRADAEAYCGWAGGRLPTEAEWESAARAGSTEGRYGPVDEVAWYANNSGRAVIDSELIWKQEQARFSDRLNANECTFHAVGLKKPNAYNLYDTLGNVWEWVRDWYAEKYYSNSPELDPRGPAAGEFGILRGGSWFTGPRVSRAAPRYKSAPDSRGFAIGIRCARDAPP